MLTSDLIGLLQDAFEDAQCTGTLRSGDGAMPWPPSDVPVCCERRWFVVDSTTVVSAFWKCKKPTDPSAAPGRAIQLTLTIRAPLRRPIPAAIDWLCSQGQRETLRFDIESWDLGGTALGLVHAPLSPTAQLIGDDRFSELERLVTKKDDWFDQWEEGERALEGIAVERSARSIALLYKLASGRSQLGGVAQQILVDWGEPVTIPLVAAYVAEQERRYAHEPSRSYPRLLAALDQRCTLDAWMIARR